LYEKTLEDTLHEKTLEDTIVAREDARRYNP
jgi:hypothetical protein